jgi:hypothetical protein
MLWHPRCSSSKGSFASLFEGPVMVITFIVAEPVLWQSKVSMRKLITASSRCSDNLFAKLYYRGPIFDSDNLQGSTLDLQSPQSFCLCVGHPKLMNDVSIKNSGTRVAGMHIIIPTIPQLPRGVGPHLTMARVVEMPSLRGVKAMLQTVTASLQSSYIALLASI